MVIYVRMLSCWANTRQSPPLLMIRHCSTWWSHQPSCGRNSPPTCPNMLSGVAARGMHTPWCCWKCRIKPCMFLTPMRSAPRGSTTSRRVDCDNFCWNLIIGGWCGTLGRAVRPTWTVETSVSPFYRTVAFAELERSYVGRRPGPPLLFFF